MRSTESFDAAFAFEFDGDTLTLQVADELSVTDAVLEESGGWGRRSTPY